MNYEHHIKHWFFIFCAILALFLVNALAKSNESVGFDGGRGAFFADLAFKKEAGIKRYGDMVVSFLRQDGGFLQNLFVADASHAGVVHEFPEAYFCEARHTLFVRGRMAIAMFDPEGNMETVPHTGFETDNPERGGEYTPLGFAVSPDCSELVFATMHEISPEIGRVNEVSVVDLEKGTARKLLLSHERTAQAPKQVLGWSYDADTVYLTDSTWNGAQQFGKGVYTLRVSNRITRVFDPIPLTDSIWGVSRDGMFVAHGSKKEDDVSLFTLTNMARNSSIVLEGGEGEKFIAPQGNEVAYSGEGGVMVAERGGVKRITPHFEVKGWLSPHLMFGINKERILLLARDDGKDIKYLTPFKGDFVLF